MSNKRKKYNTPGQKLTKKVIEVLNKNGFLVQRNNSGIIFINNPKPRAVRLGIPGAPDVVGCTPNGKFIGIECKSDRDRISDKQIEIGNEIKRRHGIYIIVKKIEDLEYIINEYK